MITQLLIQGEDMKSWLAFMIPFPFRKISKHFTDSIFIEAQYYHTPGTNSRATSSRFERLYGFLNDSKANLQIYVKNTTLIGALQPFFRATKPYLPLLNILYHLATS